jgi:hypothetical protein
VSPYPDPCPTANFAQRPANRPSWVVSGDSLGYMDAGGALDLAPDGILLRVDAARKNEISPNGRIGTRF